MRIMNKSQRLSVLALALTLLSGSLLAQGMPPTLVVAEPVSSMEFHDQVTLIGRTEARSSSKIVSGVAGAVAKINIAEGAPVAKGEALVSVDSRRIKLLYVAKRAEAAEAKSQSDLAQRNLERAEKLYQENAIAESRLDSKDAAATAALEKYNRLNAEERRLKLDYDNCVIRSPFSGYTIRKLVDIGEWVAIGEPVFQIVDLTEIKVTVELPERHFGHLSVGSEVTIIISGDKENPLTGIVSGIAPSANIESHTFPVYIAVDNSAGLLGGGMLVRATLSLNERFTSLAVSKDAVVRQPSGQVVYTIADGKAKSIPVKTGSTSGNMIAVSGKGLSEGMPVVVRGNERISPGAPVRTADSNSSNQTPGNKSREKQDGGAKAENSSAEGSS